MIAPPLTSGGKFCVLDGVPFNRMDYEEQAVRLKKVCDSYRVTCIGIGQGVYRLVRQFFPGAQPSSKALK
nr:hypothetical protein [Niveibacterium sp. COAC-50]